MIFDREIREYESLLKDYKSIIIETFDNEEFIRYNEILLSAHGCGAEGNLFSLKWLFSG